MLKQKKVALLYVAAFHGYTKEEPEESWTLVCVCGRARRVQLQVAHGMRELLLSLAVRSSSECTVPSTGCQAWLSSGGGNVALWKGSDV